MAQGRDRPPRRRGREDRARVLRRRRVLAGGRVAHRARLPRPGRRGGHRGRRHHDQHPRHRRLHGAGRVRRAVPLPAQERARHRQRHARRCTATTTSAWRWPTAWRPSSPAPARSSARINGIGERAGNCSLEEVVMALRTRAAFFNARTGIDTTPPLPHQPAGGEHHRHAVIPRNKAVVGENAFAHESGIHQHGMLEAPRRPTRSCSREDVGIARRSPVLGKHSGRACLPRARPASSASSSAMRSSTRVFDGVQGAGRPQEGNVRRRHRGPGAARRGGQRRPVEPRPARHGLRQRRTRRMPPWRCATPMVASVEREATGDGPVDAAFKAIELVTGVARHAAQVRGAQPHRGRGRPGRGAGLRSSTTTAAAIAAPASAPTSSRRRPAPSSRSSTGST